jgi:hypothetical protein
LGVAEVNPESSTVREFRSFAEFYPYYLGEHSQPGTRRLHFVGTLAAIGLVAAFAVTLNWWLLLAAPVAGYLVAWIGHGFVERNRPATFRHPWYSFLGDWVMFKDMLTGRIRF